MRIGVLSQWFDPEPGPASLPGVLARGLADRGHDVHVLTGFPNYPDGQVAAGYQIRRRFDETLGNVHVRRVALYPSHDSSVLRRTLTYGSFAASALLSGIERLRGMDAVWVGNSPVTVAAPMWWIRYRHQVPVLLHVLDLWPDNVAASGFMGNGGLRAVEGVLSSWCGHMYRAASSVAYISPGVGRLLQGRGVPADKLTYIPLWADEHPTHATARSMRAELGLDESHVVLVYAGTLGGAQGLESLVDACAKVDDPNFRCLVAGSGVSEADLRRRARDVGATNVRFLGRVPKERVPALMATGDIHYVSLRPSAMAAYTMPSKVQATLAAGKAMLVAADGDVASVARESGAGIAVGPADPAKVLDGIRQATVLGRGNLRLLGERGRDYYHRTFSAETGVGRVESALQRIARQEKTHAG
ncbi:Glycosyltransferase involved in cell wall bisynthesis [Actinopolymorpha cephalotaxi]|nr:glycosyltransferase family 4 protein [Actinopolymorpha cephalotaxi]SFG60785.1 Glycosyltransferase involved in cell wall bisynthesis [Actinopolymorpha cephalotaxi]